MHEGANPPVALVTGGSKGIGRAICVEMAKSGYQVIVNYLSDADGASETLSLVEQQGGRGICLGFDVSDYAATQPAMEKIFATYSSLDVLVNNAGRIADELFIMMTPDKWRNVIDVTLQGFYNVHAAGPGENGGSKEGGRCLDCIGGRHNGQPRPGQLRGGQGRADRRQPFGCVRSGAPWHPCQRSGAGLDPDPDDPRRAGPEDQGHDPHGPPWGARGGGPSGPFPLLRRCLLYYRAGHQRQWGHVLSLRIQTMKWLVLALSLLCIGWADSWEQLGTTAGAITSVQAEFVQEKHLPILAKPLVSKGVFYYQVPGSMRWEYQSPLRSILTAHDGHVRRFVSTGEAGFHEETGVGLEAMQVVVKRSPIGWPGAWMTIPCSSLVLSREQPRCEP